MLRADTRLGRLVKALAGSSAVAPHRPTNRVVAALAAVPPAAATEAAPVNRLNNYPARGYGVPALLSALAVIVISSVTFVLNADPSAQRALTLEEEPRSLSMYDGEPLAPWSGYVNSGEDRGGTEFVSGAASQSAISAGPNGLGGMRVTWHGDTAQVYLQNPEDAYDLSSYVDADGAVVFDIVVHQKPVGEVKVAVHCGYPCAAELPLTELVEDLERNRRVTVRIPLSCFVSVGLNPTTVSTPFLVHATAPFDATFFDIRWERGAATDDDATSCGDLR